MAGATIDNINIVATADVSSAIKSIEKLQEKLSGIKSSATKAAPAVQKVEKTIDKAGKTANHASSGVSKFAAAIKRVIVYRMLRGAIKAITQAFSEGTKNAYMWAQANNDAFQQVRDTYATRTNYLKNTLGALASTVLTALLPAFLQITNVLIEIINAVNEFIAAVTGQDSFLKAREVAVDFAEATDDAAKSQKKLNQQLMAFDELNVITTPKDNAKGNNDDEKWNDAFVRTSVTRFKDIAGIVGKVLSAVKRLMPDFEYIERLFSAVFDTVSLFINGFVDGFVANIDLEGMKKTFETIFKLATDIFNKLNEWGIPQRLGEAIGKLSSLVLDLTTFGVSQSLEHINNALELLEGILTLDLEKIGNAIVNDFGAVVKDVFGPIIKIIDYLNQHEADHSMDYLNDKATEAEKDVNVYGVYGGSYAGSSGYTTFYGTAGSADPELEAIKKKAANRTASVKATISNYDPKYHIMTQEEINALKKKNGYASGGYPSMGSVFVAGEIPGQAEMVGNINGRTGVASGEEITGISEAVYSTGGETNALLRELISVAASGNGKPNAAFGKFVSQSLNLYKGVTG